MTSFSRKQLARRAAAAGAIFAAVTVLGSPARAGDDFPVVGDIRIPMPRILEDDGPLPPPEGRYVGRYEERPYPQRPYADSYRPGRYGSGPHVAIPSARYERSPRPMLPPEQVVTVLRSSGYSPLGRVTQRGWIYTIAAFDRYGEDGRLIIDARTGQIIRFIPAQAIDERIMGAYGPPAPPPTVYAGYENRRGSLLDLRHAPRPPNAVPKTARRPAPKAATQTAQPSPAGTAITPPATAPAQQAAVPATEPAAAKPAVAEAKPAAATVGAAAPSTLKLWPTQAMPDVQPLE
ncbi:MAG: hypothetical protein Q7V17_16750 [Afipia sp.]|nr:hypothetical protein [Afipia sp.]